MKIRVLLLTVFTVFSFSISQAQNSFLSGDKVAQVGIGLGSYLGTGNYKTTFPSTVFSYEFGVADYLFDEKSALGLGLIGGYSAGEQTMPVNWGATTNIKYKHNFFLIAGRSNFHYQFVDNLDTYAGLSVGYNLATSKYEGPNTGIAPTASDVGGFLWGLHVGGRYYFIPNFAAFAEVGYGISPITVGLALKL